MYAKKLEITGIADRGLAPDELHGGKGGLHKLSVLALMRFKSYLLGT